MKVQAVFFDVGETLVNESRLWNGWARYLGVSSREFFVALEDVIRAGEHHCQVFERFEVGFDVDAARRKRVGSGDADVFDAADLYPDALPCLQKLRSLGLIVGIAGNQPREAEEALRGAGFEADFIASSSGWGVAKPSPEFFARIIDAAGLPAAAVAYVGDRLDNDVIPARASGMTAIFLERGPWGKIHARHPDIGQAHIALKRLDELADRIFDFNADESQVP